MSSVHSVADYFLLDAAERGQRIRHMRLQKLCYYAQGFYVALYDRPLFTEPLAAWQYGPVAPALWSRFHQFRSKPIPVPETRSTTSTLSQDDQDFLDLVIARLDGYPDWDLSHATHQEAPWRDARLAMKDGAAGEIGVQALRNWFGPRAYQLSVNEAPGPPTDAQIRQARSVIEAQLGAS